MRSVFNQQPGRGDACEEGGDCCLDRSGLARNDEGRAGENRCLLDLLRPCSAVCVSTCRIYRNVTSAVRPFWQSSISSATCQSTLSENNSSRCARPSGSRPRTTLQSFPTAEREDASASIASRYASRNWWHFLVARWEDFGQMSRAARTS